MRTLRRVAGLAAATMLLSSLALVPAQADDHPWTSLYAGTAYEGAGWEACQELPVTISLDTRALNADQKAKAKAALLLALDKWSAPGNLRFVYGGEIPVAFNRTTGVSTPEDGIARDRWIYVTLVKASSSKTSDTAVVGLAGPLRVDPTTKNILEGSAAFQAQYVNRQSKALVAELFAHEMGHIGGLGHSSSKADVMYAILSGKKKLGPGDVAGAAALHRPCTSAQTPPAAG